MNLLGKNGQPGRVKSAMIRALGGSPFKLTDAAFWNAYYGTGSSSGQTVSQQTALQMSTVWACVRLIAETIATLPLALYERKGTSSVVAADHPVNILIGQQPNADQTPVEFWECVAAAMLLNGNGYVDPVRSSQQITSLEFLLPQRMSPPQRMQDGSIQYRYSDLDGKQRIFTDDSMMHLRGFGTDPLCGLSPIAMGRNVIGSAMAADESAAKMFAAGMKLSGILSTDQVLTPKQRGEIRADMESRFAGAMNAGKSMVLEAGMKYQQVSMTPEDAQMLETRAFNVEEICRWFRVPPFMVGHTEKSTSWGTGIEQQMIGFLTFTLLPWMKRIEQSINRRLLTPSERPRFFAKFNPEGLLRADSAARASFYSQMTQNGIYTRDDCREKENLPRRGGKADELTVQSNLLPIDMLGEAATSGQQARTALLDWLNSDSSTGTTE